MILFISHRASFLQVPVVTNTVSVLFDMERDTCISDLYIAAFLTFKALY